MKMILIFLICIYFAACSFDYGSTGTGEETKPDIIMVDVDYVRIRGGDPTMRFRADLAERYEESQTMRFLNINFEQFENRGTEINSIGTAGEALFYTDTGNANLSRWVRVEIESEDIIIETYGLSWRDEEKELIGNENDEVEIIRSDGTRFIGRGFYANIRERTWEFSAGAEGRYVDEDNDEDEENDVDDDYIDIDLVYGEDEDEFVSFEEESD